MGWEVSVRNIVRSHVSCIWGRDKSKRERGGLEVRVSIRERGRIWEIGELEA